MKALILSAGFGTRMAPISDTIPKPLIPVLNRPVIEYNIHFLKHFGIEEIYINLYYKGEKIENYLGNGKKYGVRIKYLREREILGTGGAIGTMRSFVDSPFIVINSDTIFNFDLNEMIDCHKMSDSLATLGVISSPAQDSRSVIRVEDNKIVRMLNASFYDEIPEGNAIFTGIHIIDPKLLEYIPENIFISITNYLYQRFIKQKRPLNAFFINDGKWWDVGTPNDYLECSFDLFNSLPLPFFNIFENYHHTTSEELCQAKMGEIFVALGKNLKIPALGQNPPIVIGNGCDLEEVVSTLGAYAVLGPNLILGERVKLSGKTDVANAVYLPEADGSKVIYCKKGKIFY